MDNILTQAAVEMNPAKRKQLYADLQKKIDEDVVFIYLPQEFTSTVYWDKVKNPPSSAFGPIAPWDNVYLEGK